MSDKITLNSGSGGADVIAENITGNSFMPVSKIHTGALDADGGPVTATNPLPVEISDGTNVLGTTAHPIKVDGSATTQPVSAAALPLPSGAATGAKQDTANTSLANLDGKAPALGQALAAASVPVVLTAAQVTALTPTAAITGFATSAKQDAAQTTLASILTALGATVLAAGTALIGAVAAALRTDSIMNGTTSLTPKFATATLSATGPVVALVSGKKIRVLRYSLMTDAACTVYFRTIATTTQISGTKYLAATGGAGGTFCLVGHFETLSGEALGLMITGAANVSVDLTYVEV